MQFYSEQWMLQLCHIYIYSVSFLIAVHRPSNGAF